jgi:hypothetical protein
MIYRYHRYSWREREREKCIPDKAVIAAMTLPKAVWGTTSPYPTDIDIHYIYIDIHYIYIDIHYIYLKRDRCVHRAYSPVVMVMMHHHMESGMLWNLDAFPPDVTNTPTRRGNRSVMHSIVCIYIYIHIYRHLH